MKALIATLFAIGTALLGWEMVVRYIQGNVHADFMPAVSVLVLAMAIKLIWGGSRTSDSASS